MRGSVRRKEGLGSSLGTLLPQAQLEGSVHLRQSLRPAETGTARSDNFMTRLLDIKLSD